MELLRERGVEARGVDSNEDMVDFCRDRGLPVVRADMFDFVAGLPEGSIDGLFLSQVVEHLPPFQILRLLRMCARATSAKSATHSSCCRFQIE